MRKIHKLNLVIDLTKGGFYLHLNKLATLKYLFIKSRSGKD